MRSSRTVGTTVRASPGGRSVAASARAGISRPALAAQEELLAELDALGETDGYVFEEIAECLLALGLDDEARPYVRSGVGGAPRGSELSVDEPERLERLRALAG